MLRDCAESLAGFIRDIPEFVQDSNVTVIVEDKAVVAYELSNALAQLGVAVLVSFTGMTRRDGVPVPQGNLEIQISCYEQPELNRTDPSSLTAQRAAEIITRYLHYRKFPYFVGQMIFKDFGRDDTDEANIVRINFEVNTALGFEDKVFCRENKNNNNQNTTIKE